MALTGYHHAHPTRSHRARIAKRRRAYARKRLKQQRKQKQLAQDLAAWQDLAARRRALAQAAAERGESWESQAAAQGLPIDEQAFALHRRCAALIADQGLRRGVPAWTRKVSIEPISGWHAYEQAAQMPKGSALRAVVSDSLSFPLTAAHAAHIAGVTADAHGRLSLLVLGPEVGSELSGRSKWAELLDGHGLGATELCVCFCGPRVPTSLDGAERRVRIPSGVLRFAFLRGVWHDPRVQARVPLVHSAPQLALAFNSGLADYAAGWLPTMRALFWQRGIPLACTSYHAPEAELDARTLAVSMRVPLHRMKCGPNPFASRLPHLDELAPGLTYTANAFLTVCLPPAAS